MALLYSSALQHVGVEGREETEQVRRVVDGGVVEQNQVLVGGPAAHVQAGAAFAHRLHPRQRQNHAQNVGFAKHRGHLAHGLDVELFQAHLQAGHVLVLLGFHHYFLQRHHVFFHLNVEPAVVAQYHLAARVLDAHAADFQLVRAHGQRQREGPELVGADPDFSRLRVDGGPNHRLARLVVADASGQRGPAAGASADAGANGVRPRLRHAHQVRAGGWRGGGFVGLGQGVGCSGRPEKRPGSAVDSTGPLVTITRFSSSIT